MPDPRRHRKSLDVVLDPLPVPTVHLISPAESAVAAAALGDAFADDPVMGWVGGFTDAPDRMTHVMRGAIDGRFRRPGQPLVFLAGEGHGAAIWDPPGVASVTNRELFRALPAVIRGFRFGLPRMKQLIDVMDAHHPEEPHYYLFAIGARRNAQGTGVGTALMQTMLDRCDDEGVPAYLENSKPRNEAFYARHGFVGREPLPMPSGCPAMQPMWRQPR